MKNSFLRTLVPLLSIGLNDAGADGGGEPPPGGGGDEGTGAGADNGGAAAGGSADKKPDPAKGAEGDAGADAAAKADAAKADQAKQAEATKAAAAELGKAYEKWEPALPKELPFDKARFGDLKKLGAELGIAPEKFQKAVDAFANGELGRLKSVAEGLIKERQTWQASLKADKELAGEDGKQLEKTMATARRAMRDASPEFRKLLKDSGLESHPEMIRFAARLGGKLKEDETGRTARSSGKGPERTPDQKLRDRYDHPTSAEMFGR